MRKTLVQREEENNTVLREREKHITRAVDGLRILEESEGYIAVFSALRRWLNKPVRGSFK